MACPSLTNPHMTQLAKKYSSQLSQQNYSPQKNIDGVKIIELKQFSEDGGDFIELGRMKGGILQDIPEFEVQQVNYSCMLPGVIKAAHVHKRQDDVWFVPPQHRLVVGLLDVREDSPTQDNVMRFVLGGFKARLLFIPRGVAHGCANLTQSPVVIFYFSNQHFTPDPASCDEFRLPWDIFGKDFFSLTKS